MHPALPHFGAHHRSASSSIGLHTNPFLRPISPFKRTSLYSPLLQCFTCHPLPNVPTSATLILTTRIACTLPGRCLPTLPSLNETIWAKSPQIIDDRHPLDILYSSPTNLHIPKCLWHLSYCNDHREQFAAGQVTYTRGSPTVVFFSHVLVGVQRHYPSA
jgi:hypothetical protein